MTRFFQKFKLRSRLPRKSFEFDFYKHRQNLVETLVESVKNLGTFVETLFIFVESLVDFCGIFVKLLTNIVETYVVSKDNFSERLESQKRFFRNFLDLFRNY